jgi:hypothetical protein
MLGPLRIFAHPLLDDPRDSHRCINLIARLWPTL